MGKVRTARKRKRKRGEERNANITNEEGPSGENEIDPEQERNETDPDPLGEYWDVNYTGNGYGSLIDLDLGEVGNYGADREAGQFLQNNEETQGYEELRRPTEVGVFRIFAKEQILRGGRGKPRNSSQLHKKSAVGFKGRNGFREILANVGELEKERKKSFG